MFIKPLDRAILTMILEGDLDLTTHLNEHLKTNETEQRNKTFWFPTHDNPGKTEYPTPMQTRILEKVNKLKHKERVNNRDDVESRWKILGRFD